MNEKPVIKNVIARCGADKILPITATCLPAAASRAAF